MVEVIAGFPEMAMRGTLRVPAKTNLATDLHGFSRMSPGRKTTATRRAVVGDRLSVGGTSIATADSADRADKTQS